MARTVGERDRARGAETVSRPRSEPSASQRRRAAARTERKQKGPRRSEDAETIDEALEIERETGQREGAAARTVRPIVRYGPDGADRVDKPPADRESSARGPSSASSSSSSARSAGSFGGIGAPLAADVLIITADEIVNQHRAPIPSRLLVAFGVFGVLSLASGQARRPALVFAWGIVTATFYSAAPGKKPAALNAVAALGDFLGGKYGTPSGAANIGKGTAAPPPVAGPAPGTNPGTSGSAGIVGGSYGLPA
jgi:hypothetical protein